MLCDNLEGWSKGKGGRLLREEDVYTHTHTDVGFKCDFCVFFLFADDFLFLKKS